MLILPNSPDPVRSNRRARTRRFAIRLGIGTLALILLATVSRSVSAGFETQARETIREALDENEMEWVQLHVWRRRVQLKGERPELGQGGKALDVAREARCSFMLVEVACAGAVTADFGDLEPDRTVDRDAT